MKRRAESHRRGRQRWKPRKREGEKDNLQEKPTSMYKEINWKRFKAS